MLRRVLTWSWGRERVTSIRADWRKSEVGGGWNVRESDGGISRVQEACSCPSAPGTAEGAACSPGTGRASLQDGFGQKGARPASQ